MVNFPDNVLLKTNYDVLVEFTKKRVCAIKNLEGLSSLWPQLDPEQSSREKCQVSDWFLYFLPPSDPWLWVRKLSCAAKHRNMGSVTISLLLTEKNLQYVDTPILRSESQTEEQTRLRRAQKGKVKWNFFLTCYWQSEGRVGSWEKPSPSVWFPQIF